MHFWVLKKDFSLLDNKVLWTRIQQFANKVEKSWLTTVNSAIYLFFSKEGLGDYSVVGRHANNS